MIGLTFFATLIAFVALLIWLSGLLTRKMRPGVRKVLLRAVMVVGVFPLMVADEIIGKYQFEALCKTCGVESMDLSAAKGKHVKVEYGERNFVKWTAVPIRESNVNVYSAENNDLLFKYKDYYANGGWIMRYTPISLGYPSPMLFDGNGCGFPLKRQIFRDNNIEQIN